jgi:hypothetical protein
MDIDAGSLKVGDHLGAGIFAPYDDMDTTQNPVPSSGACEVSEKRLDIEGVSLEITNPLADSVEVDDNRNVLSNF